MALKEKQGRHATNDASLMCENCGVGRGVGSDNSGGGSGGVDEIVAKGPKDVLKRYFPLQWLNCPLYGVGLGGGGGGGGVDEIVAKGP